MRDVRDPRNAHAHARKDGDRIYDLKIHRRRRRCSMLLIPRLNTPRCRKNNSKIIAENRSSTRRDRNDFRRCGVGGWGEGSGDGGREVGSSTAKCRLGRAGQACALDAEGISRAPHLRAFCIHSALSFERGRLREILFRVGGSRRRAVDERRGCTSDAR